MSGTGINYVVIDIESNIKNVPPENVGKFKASPFHPANNIVLYGEKREGSKPFIIGKDMLKTVNSQVTEEAIEALRLNGPIYVGHNIGFDLLYLRKNLSRYYSAMSEGIIWDTMIVRYLLTGQYDQYASLDSLAPKAGGTLKDDKIKGYWNDGIDTEDIPMRELIPYLENDLLNTEKVFLQQLEEAHEKGMLPLIRVQMDARLATIEMEWNGMHVDKEGLIKHRDKEIHEHGLLAKEALKVLEKRFDLPFGVTYVFNAGSARQLSTALFGGTVQYVEHEDVLDEHGAPVRVKSGPNKGKVKTKRVHKAKLIEPMCKFTPAHYGARQGAAGYYGTGEDVLKKIASNKGEWIEVKQFVELLLILRKKEKDISAFLDSTADLIWHDGCVHPQYQHTATATGRLSCKSPNLQQVSGKDT